MRPTMLRVVVLVLLAALLAVPAASRPAQAAGVRTIRQFDTADRVVALTFDAGADRGYAPEILDTLAAKGVKASFGMTGVWASQNPDLAQRMVREGHSMINHTWDHRSFTGRSTGAAPLSSAERALELSRTADLVFAQTGVRLAPYFRPPYGDYDDSVLADLAASGYTLNIMWTIDSLGWNGLSAPAIERRVVDNVAPGAIVLMHVGAQSADAQALPAIIDDLRARGYRFASVADLVAGSPRPSSRLFPQTGYVVRDRFLYFWEDFGGLPVFGYPLTDAATDPVSGLTVQTFERARFELHPGADPAHYDVLLGLLGSEATRGRRPAATGPFAPVGPAAGPTCAYYPQTQHRLCAGFRAYWQRFGGLAVYGYPISEEYVDPATGLVTQWFERARFEWHPGVWPARYDVLLGRLGAEALARR